MYGTVAHMRAKPGMGAQFAQLMREFDHAQVPGFVTSYVYQMDKDSNDYMLAVLFDSKESYRANADSPEQNAASAR